MPKNLPDHYSRHCHRYVNIGHDLTLNIGSCPLLSKKSYIKVACSWVHEHLQEDANAPCWTSLLFLYIRIVSAKERLSCNKNITDMLTLNPACLLPCSLDKMGNMISTSSNAMYQFKVSKSTLKLNKLKKANFLVVSKSVVFS